jgi:hypothetical protein
MNKFENTVKVEHSPESGATIDALRFELGIRQSMQLWRPQDLSQKVKGVLIM